MLPDESRQIAALIDGLSTPGFGEALDAMLRQAAAFDLSGVFVFPYDARPFLLHDGYTRHVAPQAWTAYLGGAYLLDPFYVACNNRHPAGLWRMRDLAPDDFFDTQFSTSREVHPCVSTQSGSLVEEVGFLVPLEGGVTATYSLMRVKGHSGFSDTELESLRAYEPIVQAAIRASWRRGAERLMPAQAGRDDLMEEAFGRLCADRLTLQQRNIVRLILRGHSNASIGKSIGISEGTVRIHRKNIYKRLAISSQAELFRIFIDHLNQHNLY
ncbi:helix-turn-helix transcriptional regulator [Rhizobium sp. PL01]|uniref:helix-turn-helix domain-containing protein n=1 Tax=Rhizobium sp. PL01 TaxID=3085631 RepID=UPI002980F38C|nr:helix-turn-helix transcriptional regulator [Rhizobium sp. PL01]